MRLRMDRRQLLKTMAALGVTSQIRGARAGEAKHTFVIITLTGGFDHSMFLPVFKRGSTNELTPAVHFATNEVFPFYNGALLANPNVLSLSHPLIDRFGHLVKFVDGIYMDGQNDHVGAVATLVKGTQQDGHPSFAAVLGELLGYGTQYGVVSFGKAPYHSAGPLSHYASGIVLPKDLTTVAEMVTSTFGAADWTQADLDDVAREFYAYESSAHATYGLSGAKEPKVLADFRNFSTRTSAQSKRDLIASFSVESSYLAPYMAIQHGYGATRFQPFAATAKMINKGDVAGCFLIPVGKLEGFDSYDTHNNFENDRKQQEMQSIDFRALAIFLEQIQDKLDSTTIIVQSEFGRTPLLNAANGKDHWGFNNAFVIISSLFKPGRFGAVNPDDYGPLPLSYSDGSRGPLTCRGIYRGIMEMLVDRGLVTAPASAIDEVMRQYLQGPVPKELFT